MFPLERQLLEILVIASPFYDRLLSVSRRLDLFFHSAPSGCNEHVLSLSVACAFDKLAQHLVTLRFIGHHL